MNELERARITINEIDRELVDLFEKRMQAVHEVLLYKKANDLPVFDESRERENIARTSALLQDSSLIPYFVEYYQHLMDVSKTYQKDLLEK